MKLLVKFLSVFLLALVVTACSSDDNTPEVAAEKFIKDSYSGNVDGILDALYIPDELKTNGVDIKVLMKSKMKVAIDQAVATAKQNGGIDQVKIFLTEYNNDKTQATIKTIIIFKDGTENNSALSLIKVDGKWLINIK